MSQGKVLVEFKKANGGNIEVSEEKFLQSQKWFEKIDEHIKSQTGGPDAVYDIGEYDNDENIFDPKEKDYEMPMPMPERESSMSPTLSPTLSPTYEDEPMKNYHDDLPKTPAIIIRNTAKFKPFTPPTISDKTRQEMIAQRNSDRKRKANDDVFAPSTPTAPVPIFKEPALVITPEMLERSRRNREAAIAKRRSLQNMQSSS